MRPQPSRPNLIIRASFLGRFSSYEGDFARETRPVRNATRLYSQKSFWIKSVGDVPRTAGPVSTLANGPERTVRCDRRNMRLTPLLSARVLAQALATNLAPAPLVKSVKNRRMDRSL